MIHSFRSWAGFAALAALGLALCVPAQAQKLDYPNKPVRMIVTFPPGGSADAMVRLLSPRLTDKLGQQVVVDNRPGAGGLIGSGIVAKATPDGYTLAMVAAPHLVGPLLQSNPP
ncbi:MAG: tripartite tricarboxylate transporter substrate binding protein, partial [Burkholderiales bacterium]|nr:tripartite tricarboxylate transporter substrate binding protein [Burkholderiales bacterium]